MIEVKSFVSEWHFSPVTKLLCNWAAFSRRYQFKSPGRVLSRNGNPVIFATNEKADFTAHPLRSEKIPAAVRWRRS
jgi:hypothetical protein